MIRIPPKNLSASKINSMDGCPRKYWYKYIEGIRDPYTPSYFAEGRAFHAALEMFYNQLKDHESLADLDEMIAYACHVFTNQVRDVINREDEFVYNYKNKSKSSERETREDVFERLKRLITAFYSNPYIPQEIVAVEHYFKLDLGGDKYLSGYIDLVTRENGVLCITDHKTVGSKSPTFKSFDDSGKTYDTGMFERLDTQMGIYGMVGKLLFNEPTVKLYHQEVTKAKSPVCRWVEYRQPENWENEIKSKIANHLELADLACARPEGKLVMGRTRSYLCGTCLMAWACETDNI